MNDVKVETQAVQLGVDFRPQVRSRKDGWTPARQRVFFAHLAATCNIAHAARQAGMSKGGAYERRAIDPAFRERWRQALEEGYVRLEAMLLARHGGTAIAHAMRAEAQGDVEAAEALWELTESLDTDVALRMLALHQKALRGCRRCGARKQGGPPVARASQDQLADAIEKQLSALNRRRRAE